MVCQLGLQSDETHKRCNLGGNEYLLTEQGPNAGKKNKHWQTTFVFGYCLLHTLSKAINKAITVFSTAVVM